MAAFSYPIAYAIRCSSNRDNHQDANIQKLSNIKIKGTSTQRTTDILSQKVGALVSSSVASVTQNESLTAERTRQNIPTMKQLVDPFRQGLIIEGGVGYRQTVVIRSYEVGPDKTATLESILNLLQVTQFTLKNFSL